MAPGCPTLKAVKFGSVQDVYDIGDSRLRRIMQSRKLTIKIKDGVKPEVAARIFRVLGSRIDKMRHPSPPAKNTSSD